MANLINDIGAAIVTTITGNASLFGFLGNTGGALHAEYGAQAKTYAPHRAGRCLVRHTGYDVDPAAGYAASAQGVFRYALEFDLVDIRDAATAVAGVSMAMASLFSDRGATLFANLTDNGSNRLGASGVTSIGQTFLETEDDPDRPRVVAELVVSLWHVVPLT